MFWLLHAVLFNHHTPLENVWEGKEMDVCVYVSHVTTTSSVVKVRPSSKTAAKVGCSESRKRKRKISIDSFLRLSPSISLFRSFTTLSQGTRKEKRVIHRSELSYTRKTVLDAWNLQLHPPTQNKQTNKQKMLFSWKIKKRVYKMGRDTLFRFGIKRKKRFSFSSSSIAVSSNKFACRL